jgi:hypothetical protein
MSPVPPTSGKRKGASPAVRKSALGLSNTSKAAEEEAKAATKKGKPRANSPQGGAKHSANKSKLIAY